MHWNRGLNQHWITIPSQFLSSNQGLSSHPRKMTSFFGDEPNIYQRMTQKSQVAKLTVIPERTKTMEVALKSAGNSHEEVAKTSENPMGSPVWKTPPFFSPNLLPLASIFHRVVPEARSLPAFTARPPDLFPLEASSVSPWSLVLGYTKKLE